MRIGRMIKKQFPFHTSSFDYLNKLTGNKCAYKGVQDMFARLPPLLYSLTYGNIGGLVPLQPVLYKDKPQEKIN